jgi:hypothetical protein
MTILSVYVCVCVPINFWSDWFPQNLVWTAWNCASRQTSWFPTSGTNNMVGAWTFNVESTWVPLNEPSGAKSRRHSMLTRCLECQVTFAPPVRFSNEIFEEHETFVRVIFADCKKTWQPSEYRHSTLSDKGKVHTNTNYGHFYKFRMEYDLLFISQQLQTWLTMVETLTSRQNLYLCNEF